MYCSKCGSTIASNTAFCPVCGAAVQPAIAAAPAGAPIGTIAAPIAAGETSPHWIPPVTRTYGGFWLRFVAHMIDGFLLGVVALAVLLPLFILTGLGATLHGLNRDNPPDPKIVAAFASSIGLLIGGSLILGWLYSAYFESSEWQGTVGKKVMNLVVTDLQGNRISFARASGRYFAKLISGLIPFGIGYILAGITEKKQALHDMIAGCLVLRS
jgi:uncharacterized RDD family membrane protein YckC